MLPLEIKKIVGPHAGGPHKVHKRRALPEQLTVRPNDDSAANRPRTQDALVYQ
jgi:hypothetical protein